MSLESILSSISWLGHDSFRLRVKPLGLSSGALSDNSQTRPLTLYIDPFKLGRHEKADLVLISHEHFDHFSADDLRALVGPGTIVITNEAVAGLLVEAVPELTADNLRIVQPGESVAFDSLTITAVPAYNLTKFRSPGVPFHPKERGGIGFLIEHEDFLVYHTGDTDLIPEMSDLAPEKLGRRIDITLLPVSGKYVMTADEAIEAALRIKPKLAIPMHYGSIVGSDDQAEAFKNGMAKRGVQSDLIEVRVLGRESKPVES